MRYIQPKGEFGTWLDSVIYGSGYTLKALSADIGITRETLASHRQMKHPPHPTTVKLYCNFFGVSYDFLWEMVERDWADKSGRAIPKGKFGNWLYDLMTENGLTSNDIGMKLDLTYATVNGHIAERHVPSRRVVKGYCDIFGEDYQEIRDLLIDDIKKGEFKNCGKPRILEIFE